MMNRSRKKFSFISAQAIFMVIIFTGTLFVKSVHTLNSHSVPPTVVDQHSFHLTDDDHFDYNCPILDFEFCSFLGESNIHILVKTVNVLSVETPFVIADKQSIDYHTFLLRAPPALLS